MVIKEASDIGIVSPMKAEGNKPHAKYERLIARAKEVPAAATIVVHPCDETSLRGAVEAAEAGIIMPVFVGPAAKMSAVAREHSLDTGRFKIVGVPHSEAAATKGVELIRASEGELLMKGSLHTDELMRAVTSSATGLRTARRISHVFIINIPSYPETLFITDATINIFPDLEAKRDIVQNAIDLFRQVGLGTPRVAILSAVETVTPKIPSTIDAAALCKMAERGQITGGILDGRSLSTMPSTPKQRRSRALNPRSLAGHKFSSSPISKQAICSQRTLPFLPKQMLPDLFLGPASQSS
jgi:phosphate acetyltransferase